MRRSISRYDTVCDAQQSLDRYVHFYYQIRPHRALDGRTPDRMYCGTTGPHSLPLRRLELPGPRMNRQNLSNQAEPSLRTVSLRGPMSPQFTAHAEDI